ncbi:hypothetical protein [Nonomuraea sp. CA-141351]|uniref:hypothetical protein n=1 Tax=Nonomuraea sp. CA-141351 TaxID=3239996 RepID=UPI003D8A7ED7
MLAGFARRERDQKRDQARDALAAEKKEPGQPGFNESLYCEPEPTYLCDAAKQVDKSLKDGGVSPAEGIAEGPMHGWGNTKVRPGYDPAFPTIKLTNWRGRFNAWLHKNGYKRLPEDWDAHHAIPQEYRNHPEFANFDFDAPSNVRGIPGSRMNSRGANVHQDIANQWKWFKEINPNPTRAQIEDFARQIDRGYGAYFWGEPK